VRSNRSSAPGSDSISSDFGFLRGFFAMNETDTPSVVTPEHAEAFGYIIHSFAKLELHMQTVVAGMLDTDVATAILLMGDTNYRQKRQTVRNIHQTRGIDGLVHPGLTDLLDEMHTYSGVRNHIAHSIWTSGQRPGSIKPMYLKLRSEFPAPVGHWHNEKDYTLEELRAAASSLNDISRRFVQFLEDTGLMARVTANIEKIAESTDESPGNPSSK